MLDVVAKLENGQLIDIEMQVGNRAGFRSRVLFYLSRMHQSQLDVAEEYSRIKPSVSIAILGYKETEEQKFHNIYEVRERESHSLFSQDLSVHLIELPKLNSFLATHPQDKNDLILLWSRFFSAKSKPEVKALAMENPIFQRAEAALEIIMGDPQAQELARLRDKGRVTYQMDMQANQEEGEIKGRREGLKEGEIKERKKSVLKMHDKGILTEQIAEMLDLDLSFVLNTVVNRENLNSKSD